MKYLKKILALLSILGVFFLFTPIPRAQAAGITFDTSSLSGTNWPATTVANINWAHTVGASCATPILVVEAYVSVSGDVVSSATYNGTNLTLAGKQIGINGGSDNEYAWYMTNPPTNAADTIQINFSPSNRFEWAAAESLCGTGSSQPDSFNKWYYGGSTVTNPSATTTVITANSWLISIYRGGGAGDSANVGTIRQSCQANCSTAFMDSNATVGTGAQKTQLTGTADNWSGVIVSIAPPATVQTVPWFSDF